MLFDTAMALSKAAVGTAPEATAGDGLGKDTSGGGGGGGGGHDEAAVEALLERVNDGMLGADRREAMRQLAELAAASAEAAAATGELGAPVIAAALVDERGDPEMLRSALEVRTSDARPEPRPEPTSHRLRCGWVQRARSRAF